MAERRKIGAYVLIKIAPGRPRSITEQVAKVDG